MVVKSQSLQQVVLGRLCQPHVKEILKMPPENY